MWANDRGCLYIFSTQFWGNKTPLSLRGNQRKKTVPFFVGIVFHTYLLVVCHRNPLKYPKGCVTHSNPFFLPKRKILLRTDKTIK